MQQSPGITIGALAQAAGVGVETIRFYQRSGLMPAPNRPRGGVRRYDAPALARLRFIKSAQRLGFSLDQIRELLQLDDGTRCADARRLAESRLADVRQKLDDLQRIESALAELVARCGHARGRVACPLIEALHSLPARSGD